MHASSRKLKIETKAIRAAIIDPTGRSMSIAPAPIASKTFEY